MDSTELNEHLELAEEALQEAEVTEPRAVPALELHVKALKTGTEKAKATGFVATAPVTLFQKRRAEAGTHGRAKEAAEGAIPMDRGKVVCEASQVSQAPQGRDTCSDCNLKGLCTVPPTDPKADEPWVLGESAEIVDCGPVGSGSLCCGGWQGFDWEDWEAW
jgi:hypothetical protein